MQKWKNELRNYDTVFILFRDAYALDDFMHAYLIEYETRQQWNKYELKINWNHNEFKC